MKQSSRSNRTLAIVGCGAVVELFYMFGLKHLEKVGWNFIFVDGAADRATEMAGRFAGSTSSASIETVLGQASHAVVATPPASHYALCSRLLDGGVHVLCEKPLVLDPADGQDLADRAAHAGLKLQVNQTRRWFPASLAARRLVADGSIGTLTSVIVREGGRFNWPSKTAFHSQPGLARNGILSDQGSHTFDLIGWLLDRELEPVDVRHDGYAGPETTVRVEFVSGPVRGEVIMTWLVAIARKVELIGTTGRITLDDDCNRLLLQQGSGVTEVGNGTRYTSYEAVAADLLDAFVDGVDRPSVATASSVLSSVAFLDRAYKMAAANLPLVTQLGGHQQ